MLAIAPNMPTSPWGAVCIIIASAMWLPAARMFSAPHHWFVGDGEFGVGFDGRAAAGVALTATAIAATEVTTAKRRFMFLPFPFPGQLRVNRLRGNSRNGIGHVSAGTAG